MLEAYLRVSEARAPGGSLEHRLRLLTDGIALDADYLEAKLLLADAYEAAGETERASRVLASLTRRFPNYPAGRIRYGLSLRAQGRHDESILEVQAALEADPDGTVLFAAGRFAEADGDRDTAAILYRRALDRGCVAARLADRLATLMAREGRPGQAAALWERARKLDPKRVDLVGDLAWAHHQSGKSALAEQLFQEVEEEASERVRFQASRARFLTERGRYVEALQATTRALSLGGPDPEMYNLRGEAKMSLHDRWGARRDFVAALEYEEDPEMAESIRTNLARLARGRRSQEAEERFLPAVRLYRAGHRDAETELRAVVDLDPEHWQACLLLAMLYRDSLRWEDAAHAFGEVVRLRGGHPQAQSERALAMLALGRRDDALNYARTASDEAPEDVAVLSNFGLVLMELGAYEQAREVFAEARAQDPDDSLVARCIKELDLRVSSHSC